MKVLPQSKKARIAATAVVLAVLAGGGVTVALAHSGGTDLLAGSVTVIGCPKGAGSVEVAVRTLTRSTRPVPPLVQPRSPTAIRRGPTHSPAPKSSPSATSPPPSPTPSSTPSPTPSPTSQGRPTQTPSPTPSPTPTAPNIHGDVIPQLLGARSNEAAPKVPETVRGVVTGGTFHFSGLRKGEIYQLGAKVPGCPKGKVVSPANGFFVAGRTQAPAIAVVAPPTVSKTATGYAWSSGVGIDKASWQLSVGDSSSSSCHDPAGVLARGELSGGAGSFTVDSKSAVTAALKNVAPGLGGQIPGRNGGTRFTGSLHLRVVPHAAKDAPCAPSPGLDLPIVLPGLPQDGETQLEVYDRAKLATEIYGTCDVCQSGPYDPHFWGPSSAWDWADPPQAPRPFHWSTTAPGTVDGRWELSVNELPAFCKPAGVIASGNTGYAPGPLAQDSTTSPPLFTVDFGSYLDLLDKSLTYDLRVVPLDANGGCSGPASPSVALSYLPPPTNTGCGSQCLPSPTPPPAFAQIDTQVTAFQKLTGPSQTPPYCFQALVDHTVSSDFGQFGSDLVGFLTVGIGGHVAKGQEVCYTPPSKDSSFWDDLTSVVNVVIDVVSFPAKVYDMYTALIPNLLGEVIPGCGETCKSLLLTAEKGALVALGLPPSLPDASRITHDAESYLVEQAAEATGVPPEVVKIAYDKSKELIISQLSGASSAQTGFSCNWCAFDNGVRAPSVTLQVSRPATDDPALPLPTWVCVDNTFGPPATPSKYYLAPVLYGGGCAKMPTVFPPGTTLSLPIGLNAAASVYRQALVDADNNSSSQFKRSESEYDQVALEGWLGQAENTPTLEFTSRWSGTYSGGKGFEHLTLKGGVSTSSFAN